MLKAVVAVLMLWSAAALADVDNEFPRKALDLEWSATLQQVQAAYPGGTVYPGGSADEEIVYVVPGDFRLLDLDLSVPLLHFVFTQQDALHKVIWHFKYADQDAALYSIAEMLGQDYSMKNQVKERRYSWKPGRASRAMLRIGTEPQFPWAYLGVEAVKSCGCDGRVQL